MVLVPFILPEEGNRPEGITVALEVPVVFLYKKGKAFSSTIFHANLHIVAGLPTAPHLAVFLFFF